MWGGGGGLLVQFFGLRIQRHYQLGIHVYEAVVSARLNINKTLNK